MKKYNIKKNPEDGADAPPSGSGKLSIVWGCILIALLIFAFIKNGNFFREVFGNIGSQPIWALIILFALGAAYRLIDGDLLWQLGRRYQPTMTLFDGIRCAFGGAFFHVTTFGSGMGIAKIWYLSRLGVPFGEGTGIVMTLTIAYKLAVALLGVAGACFVPSLRSALSSYRVFVILGAVAALIIAACIFAVAASETLSNFLIRLGRRFCRKHENWNKKLARLEAQASLLHREVWRIIQDRPLLLRMILESILMQMTWYSIPYVALHGVIGYVPGCALTAAACMLAGVLPTPGSFGSMEVIFTMLFGKMTQMTNAASTMALYRFAATFIPFFLGIPVVLMWHGKKTVSGGMEDVE